MLGREEGVQEVMRIAGNVAEQFVIGLEQIWW
jgi:hypothetical protein